jgi:hypothetical protein
VQEAVASVNEQLFHANDVLTAISREREADIVTYRRLAEERLGVIRQMGEIICNLDENYQRLARAYDMLVEELI